MKTLAVFEPAMTFFDPVLVQFAGKPAMAREMEPGMNRLPVIVVDDQVVFTGKYPSREQLAKALAHADPCPHPYRELLLIQPH